MQQNIAKYQWPIPEVSFQLEFVLNMNVVISIFNASVTYAIDNLENIDKNLVAEFISQDKWLDRMKRAIEWKVKQRVKLMESCKEPSWNKRRVKDHCRLMGYKFVEMKNFKSSAREIADLGQPQDNTRCVNEPLVIRHAKRYCEHGKRIDNTANAANT